MPKEISQLRFLICPLKWGLGHLYRIVPIVNYLHNNFQIEIFIGADYTFKDIVAREMPFVKFISIPDVTISYSRMDNQIVKLLFQIPKLISTYITERRFIRNELHKYNIDVIISDNRYGLWSAKKLNIFITHQLYIKISPHLPFIETIASKIVKKLTRRFQYIWLPDFKENILFSGSLSHSSKKCAHCNYIGILSRFSILKKLAKTITKKHEFLFIVILSGPEPQRTIFERKLIKELSTLQEKSLIVGGETHNRLSKSLPENLTYLPFLTTKDLFECISKSKYIICRSGYTSIMDLVICSKRALLIPTPGQTEQEYLAQYMHEKQYFYTQNQKELNISIALKNLDHFFPPLISDEEKYKDEINNLLTNLI